MSVEFRPLTASRFGGEIVGVAPDLQVDDATFREIEAGWYRHSILLFVASI